MNDIDDIHRLVDARINVVSVKQSSKPSVRHKRFFVYIGGFAVSLVLGMSILAPIFNSKSGLDLFNEWMRSSVKPVDNITVGDIPVTPEPYIYVPPSRMGAFGKYVINVSYYRNWLNNTVSWRVEKSSDGAKWSDYKKFEVKKDWNSETLFEKHTVVVDADEDAFYRILTNTKYDKQLVSYEDRSGVTLYELKFKVSDTKEYTLLYNWSDYSKSAEASKTSMSKSVKTDVLSSKQYFEWAVTSNVKLKAGEQFVLDPVYGTIAAALTDSWEWDAEEGRIINPTALVRLGTSQYYLTSSCGDTGVDSDGFLRVIKVFDNNGSISKTLIDKWEFDTTDGINAGITYIGDNIYAIIYSDITASTDKIFTTTAWSSNGTLKKNIIDTFSPGRVDARSSFVHVAGDIYAVVYQESGGGFDHQLETIQISSTGIITDALIDIVEFDSTATTTVSNCYSAVMVDSDTIAIIWQPNVDYDIRLCTYNISAAGDITNTAADTWVMDTSGTTSADYCYPFIHSIGNNIFAISYADTDQDGWTKTVEISDNGNIVGNIFIDTLEWANANTILYTSMFTVNDASTIPGGAGVYGITFKDSDGDGKIYTINISSAGAIDATINDYLEFDIVDNVHYAPVVYVAGNYYFSVYTGTGADGFCFTVTIETYQAPAGGWTNVCPIASGEHPTNNSANVALQVACGGTITDGNSNHTMNVTFATNRSGSWVNKQTNSSVANNSAVNWTYSQANSASTKYWWRVYVHDGICNQTYTFSFTTAANASASWEVLDDSVNGIFTNTSTWHVKDSSINGVFTNTTVWRAVDSSINGLFTNTTAWKDVDTGINGEFTNTSYVPTWKVVDNTINGMFTNTTVWKVVDSGVNGLFTNTTKWRALDTGINGAFSNTTGWHGLDTGINGVFTNTTSWYGLDTGINGEFTNTSIPLTWKIVDNAIDGNFKNTTIWKVLDSTIDGKFTNTSQWHILDSTINGVFISTSVWHVVNNTINGSFFNDTANWNVLDNLIDGKFVNGMVWHVVDGTINGEFTNTSITWKIVSNSINGRFINYTGNATSNASVIRYGYSIGTLASVMLLCGSLMVVVPLFLFRRQKRNERY